MCAPMSTSETEVAGTLALVGGGEWRDGTRDLDAALLEASGGTEVLVLPTAAAYEHPERVGERGQRPLRQARREGPGAARPAPHARPRATRSPRPCATPASSTSPTARRCTCARCSRARRCSPRCSPRTAAARSLAASGAGATVLCDPMVDPRGGAYTVGLGVVEGLAIFPYHGSAADHLRERSIDLLPADAVLVGIDEETALLRAPGRELVGRGRRRGHALHATADATELRAERHRPSSSRSASAAHAASTAGSSV